LRLLTCAARIAVLILMVPQALPSRGAGRQPPQQSPSTGPSSFFRGAIATRVTCAAKPEQSYALFLPSAYTPEKKWPIIYAFDPLGRGNVPVELLKDAAEKHGYIVAGSYNSHNGPMKPQLEAAQAMWLDTHTRLSLDDKQIYTTGFSGGSRVASSVALSCGCVNGVIAHGAGMPVLQKELQPVPFVYFAAVGEADFNYAEMVELRQRLDALGVPNRLRRFDGGHQWAPAEVWMEALDWLDVLAMKQGRRSRDAAFLARQLAQDAARAKQMEDAADLFAAYQEYAQAARDLDGLADVSAPARRAKELQASPEVRKGEKREKEDISRQKHLTEELLKDLQTLPAEPFARRRRLAEIEPKIEDLTRAKDQAKDKRESTVARRALNQVFATAYESGEQQMMVGDPAFAATYFEIASRIAPKSPAPLFDLARAQARLGDKKGALQSLRQAVEKGLKDAALLRETSEFSALQDDPQFKKLLASLPPAAQ
jgi:dienelactone hydrolase